VDIVGFIHSLNLFDLLMAFAFALAFILGYIQGTLRRLLGLASILFSFLLAANLRDIVGGFFAQNWHQFVPQYSYMIGFGLVFVVASVVFSLVIQGLYKHQPLFAKATAVDEILGGLLGVVQAMVLLGCAIVILDSFFRLPIVPSDGELILVRDLWKAIDSSGIVHVYRDVLIPGVYTLLGPFIPADIRGLV
jgi:membrane protein required for colicin V production